MNDYRDLMDRFRTAYRKADPAGLAAVLSDDFEWHLNWFGLAEPASTGRVLRGVDAMIAELQWRGENWSQLRYENLQERFADDLVVQTFTVSGLDHAGASFEVDAVDLYPIVNARITMKDTYWKYGAPSRS